VRGVNETQDRVVSAFAIPLMQVLVGAVLFGALVGRQVDLAIFAFLVMAITGAAKLWSRLAHRRLSCHERVDRGKVFPGETVSLRIHVENNKLLPVHFRLKLASGHVLTPADPQALGGQAGGLLWYQCVTFRFDFMARRRGVYPIGLARFAAGDLLGFFPRDQVVQEPQRVVVFPRLVPLRTHQLQGQDLFGRAGADHALEDPVYLLGTRDYQQWRPARYIHWKASARHHRLQEKVFQPSTQRKVILCVDAASYLAKEAEDDFERTLEVVGSLALRLEREGQSVGLATDAPTEESGPTILAPAVGPVQVSSILETLARLRFETSGDLAAPVGWRRPIPWGTSCLLFCCEMGEGVARIKTYLTRRRVSTVLVACRVTVNGERHVGDTYALKDFYDETGEGV
jgi:uncharacterized protein (DUF58 family)